jgi:hypothetical protein
MAGKLTTSEPVRPNLPQFSLRTMFFAVTCFGIMLAVLETIGLAASCALILTLTLVGLHVAGNALGTTLRDNASQKIDEDAHAINNLAPYVPRIDQPEKLSGLYRRANLGPIVYFASAAGAITGCILGGLFLTNFANTSTRGLILGAVSSGILGGFFGLLYGCFLRAWLGAWWQASSESDDCQRRRATSSAPGATANLPPPATP